MGKTLDVSDLPEELVRELEEWIRTHRAGAVSLASERERPPIGWLKDKVTILPGFYDPLSEDLLNLMLDDVSKFKRKPS